MKTEEVIKILEENKITNVKKKKLLPLKDHWIPGVTEKIPTHSEEMQDKLEPIPCPMHEDYDDDDYRVADHLDEIKDVERMRNK